MSGGSAERATARSKSWLAAGAVLFWVAQLTLHFAGDLPLPDSLLMAVLLALLPSLALAQASVLDQMPIERLPAYWSSIASLWLLGTSCWLVGTRDVGPAALGAVGLPLLELVGWTLALTAAGIATIAAFRWFGLARGVAEAPVLRRLLPRSPDEKRVFALLAVAAGVGEEISYRGYAIPVLATLLGAPAAALVTSLIFGVLHAYQGAMGMVRTAIMGSVLAAGFLGSGSLWPPVAAHVLIDLLSGIVLADRLMSPPRAAGVGTATEAAGPEA